MATTFDTKLLNLGQAGRSRLSRQWVDADVPTNRLAKSFGFHDQDVRKLKVLLGPRPVAPPKLKHRAPVGLGRWA